MKNINGLNSMTVKNVISLTMYLEIMANPRLVTDTCEELIMAPFNWNLIFKEIKNLFELSAIISL